MSMESSDKAFNELSQEVQQQFHWYREQSSRKFQELEDLVAFGCSKNGVTEEEGGSEESKT